MKKTRKIPAAPEDNGAGPASTASAPAGTAAHTEDEVCLSRRASAPLAQPGITVGHVDRYFGGTLFGWAAIKAGDTHSPVSVELIVDGKVAGVTRADLSRGDLVSAGIGAHAFEFRFPDELWDGREHKISVRVRETGVTLPSDSYLVRLPKPGTLTRLELEGSVVVCEGVLEEEFNFDAFALCEADKVLALSSEIVREGRTFTARIPLPLEALDGRVHSFAVRAGASGKTLGELAAITPIFSTSLQAVLEHGGGPLKSSIHPSSRQRYDALSDSLKALSESENDPAVLAARLRTLATAHQAVVRGFEAKPLKKLPFAPLRFPEIASPKVSIVIPVHNKFEVTYHCLASLVLAYNEATFEVIVVDDGSDDDTTGIEKLVSGVKVLRNATAQGFVLACNLGARAARGDYVVILNNDTEVASRWLDELLWVFEHFDRVGMAGPKFVYPDRRLQEAGGIVWGNGQPWNVGRGGNSDDPAYNYARQVDYISGACIMLPRSLWNELGGFDEAFAPAYFEDTDLAFRVRQKGYKTVYTPFSEVVHFEGLTSGTSVQSGMKRYQEINRPKFFMRWIGAFRNNGRVGEDVALAKDRNVFFRALVIDHEAPRYDQEAGAYAAIQEMRLLQSLGFKLTFVPHNMAYLGRYTQYLQRCGVECVYAPFATSVHEVIEKRGKEFDLVYITRYSVANRYIEAIREHAPRAKILFCNADLHFLREIRQALAENNRDLMHTALATRDEELSVMRRVDLVLSYSEAEHAVILSHNLDSTRVAKCPWVVEVPDKAVGYEQRRDIAFLGGFGHPPNRIAVEFFVSEVMPLLRRRLPGVRFLVYGSRIPKEIEEIEAEGVEVRGWVPDVSEVFDTCRVFVVPLKSGAGIKGKLISAFAHGVPSVVSPLALEATGAAEGLEVLVAEKPQEWAEAIATLYEDPKKWTAISEASRAMARKRYSFEAGRRLMKSALEQVGLFVPDEPNTLYSRKT